MPNIMQSQTTQQLESALHIQDQLMTRVGGLDIYIPPHNLLFDYYRSYPDLMNELGRVAAKVVQKYPEATCVDIGANVGDTAAIIRSICSAPIICIDGNQSIIEILTRNAPIIGNITIIQAYLSDIDSIQHMTIDKADWNSTLLPSDASPITQALHLTTLDNILCNTNNIKLLKVDTEGFDVRILKGSERTINANQPVILFEYSRPQLNNLSENSLDVFEYLYKCGYQSILIWENNGRFILRTTLDNMELITDLHHYIDHTHGPPTNIGYLDICAFHSQDEDIAMVCLSTERNRRQHGIN